MKFFIYLMLLSFFFVACEKRDTNSLSKAYFKAWNNGQYKEIMDYSATEVNAVYDESIDICHKAKKRNEFSRWSDDLMDATLAERYMNRIEYSKVINNIDVRLSALNKKLLKQTTEQNNSSKYPYIAIKEQQQIRLHEMQKLDKNKFKNYYFSLSIMGNEKKYFEDNIVTMTQSEVEALCLNDIFTKHGYKSIKFHKNENISKDKSKVVIDVQTPNGLKSLEIIYINENGSWKVLKTRLSR